MNGKRSLYDTMADAYDRAMSQQQARDRARAAQDAQDRGADMVETMQNVYDRLNPQEAPTSATITGGTGNDILLGGAAADVGECGPFVPRYHPAFAAAVGREIEHSKDYGARRTNDAGKITAYGYFQMQDAALRDAKMKDANGNWTGRFGVFTDDDFFANKNQAQDRAYDDYLAAMERYNRAAGNFGYVGKVNERRIHDGNPMTITEAGLMAAAHRMGQEWVKDYLQWAEAGGWRTGDTPFPQTSRLRCEGQECSAKEIDDNFRAVETWLRSFQDRPLRPE